MNLRIDSDSKSEPLPALPLQQQLWLMQRIAPSVGVANISARFQWIGPLEVLSIQEATYDFVVRHPFLRTTVAASATNGLVQVSHNPQSVPINVIDIRHLGCEAKEVELNRLLGRASEEPIDEQQFPWVRVVVIHVAKDRFEIAFVFSHLICDGLSMGILCREFLHSYEARVEGVAPIWSRSVPDNLVSLVASSSSTIQPDNSDLQEPLLPYDRPPAQNPTYRGHRIPFELDETESKMVVKLSRKYEVSPFVTWLSLLHLVIFRYSSSTKFDIDIAKSGRSSEFRRMVGPFFETVRISLAATARESFVDLLQLNQARMNEANEIGPRERLPSSTRSRVLLDYQASLKTTILKNGVKVIPSEWDNGAAIAELCVGIRRNKGRYIGHVKFDVDLFDDPTVDRLIGHLKKTLAAVFMNPELPISEIEILTDAEIELFRQVNQTTVEAKTLSFADQAFCQQVERTPDAPAVVCNGQNWSYRELQDATFRIATSLRQNGIRRHDRVAIWLPRGANSVAAMLATMMCGAAYVPIDPHSPKKRQKLILDSADVRCVVTTSEQLDFISAETPTVDVETLKHSPSQVECDVFTSIERAPADIAYVLFTSGSTGQPKGVEVTHLNVDNFFLGMDSLQTTEAGCWLAVTNVAFDISVFEQLWTISRGFKVVISSGAEPGGDNSIESLAKLFRDHQVTHLQCTPAMMQLLLRDTETRTGISKLRQIFVGGDVMPGPLANELLSQSSADIFNMYGPTETTVWSTSWKLQREKTIRIGKPLPNQQVHVLDEFLKPTPLGVAGELFIAGQGVARGYHRDGDLTDSRFIQHKNLGRMFRTGDTVKMLPDGDLVFLGRNDQQVKLHGHRIELGEIELAILQYPDIEQAVALVHEKDTNARLVVFVAGSQDLELKLKEVEAFLCERLPQYMVPSDIFFLSSMPLNSAGKIDRNSLLTQAPERSIAARLADVPSIPESNGATHSRSAETWDDQRMNQLKELIREELRLKSLPPNAKWSDLAINSLEVVGLVVRVEHEMNLSLPVADIFRHSYVEETLRAAINTTGNRPPIDVEAVPLAEIEEGVI